MDLLLLFNLLLGSLLVFPYLSKGETVVLEMPDYAVIGTELKIKCSYSNFKQVLDLSLMENGNERERVSYKVADSIYQGKAVYTIINPNSGINLVIEEGTSLTAGAFTFVLPRIQCKDFTSYTCQTGDGIKSNEKTLQVRPGIESITPNMMELSVHQVYIFTCRGTVSKEGPFDVQWYRRTITQANRLIPTQQAQIIGQNDCSVQSQLSYNVTESDVPNLILWCKIDGGQSVEAKKNYTVQGETLILEMSDYEDGKELRIKCSYSNLKQVLGMSLLENGYRSIKVSYQAKASIDQGKAVYTIPRISLIDLLIEEGTSLTAGAFTFVLPGILSKGFTTYTCVTDDGIKSNEKTLQGETLILEMSDYEDGKELRIKCSYFKLKQVLGMSLMENGYERVKVSYKVADSIDQGKAVYTIPSNSGIKFEIEEGTSLTAGAFTFILPRIQSKYFTTYTCETDDIKSNEKSLSGVENSAMTNYESKTLAMAFSCIFFFLVLFTLFD